MCGAGGVVDDFSDAVLGLVERIPPGRVLAYGDIAAYLGTGGPRQVGRVMSTYGGAVPWWRVVHADGTPPVPKDRRALRRLRAEGTPLRGDRVDMRRARWHPDGPRRGRLRGARPVPPCPDPAGP